MRKLLAYFPGGRDARRGNVVKSPAPHDFQRKVFEHLHTPGRVLTQA